MGNSNLEPFKWSSSTEASYFDRWFFRFEITAKLHNLDINDASHQEEFKEFLAYYGGDDLVKVIMNTANYEKLTYPNLKIELAKHYKTENKRYNEFLFIDAKPSVDDTIRTFSNRLKELARAAAYNTNEIDHKVMMQCMQHAKSHKLKLKILETECTLKKLLEWEDTSRSVSGDKNYIADLFIHNEHTQSENTHTVNSVHTVTKTKHNPLNFVTNLNTNTCINCNSAWFQGHVCNIAESCSYCGVPGHYSINCFSRFQALQNARGHYNHNKRNQVKPINEARGKQYEPKKLTEMKPSNKQNNENQMQRANNQQFQNSKQQNDIRQPTNFKQNTMNLLEFENQFCQNFIDDNVYKQNSVFSKSIESKHDDDAIIYLNIYGKDVPFLKDTGARANAMSSKTFDNIINKPNLTKTAAKMQPFGSNTIVTPRGAFHAKLTINNITDTILIYVVESENEQDNILSLYTCKKFNLVTFNQNNVQLTDQTTITKQNIETANNQAKQLSQIIVLNETLLKDRENFIKEMKNKYPKVFEDRIGLVPNVKIHIDVDKQIKPSQKIYDNVPYSLMEGTIRKINELTNAGVLSNCNPHENLDNFIGTIRPVEKKEKYPDGVAKVRLTADSTGLNKAIIRRPRKLPDRKTVLKYLNNKKVFSRFDIKEAFHTLELDEESKKLTTISTPVGFKRINRLWMGCCVASELYHDAMSHCLAGLNNTVHQIDDVFVASESWEQAKKDTEACIKRLNDLNLTVNPEKMQILAMEAKFWGFEISGNGIRPCMDKLAALRNAAPPSNASEVHSLISTLSYYIDRTPYLSTLAEPLRELMSKKNTHFKWEAKHTDILTEIKKNIMDTALDHYDCNAKLELWVDAGPNGSGCFLVQNKGNNVRSLIGCNSKTHSKSQKNYSQIEKECEACVWGCYSFLDYLRGRPFTLYTDNQSAAQILNVNEELKKQTTIRLQLWRSALVQFSGIKVEFIAGKNNMADYLSRCLSVNTEIKSQTILNINDLLHDDEETDKHISNMLSVKHYIKSITINEIARETDKDTALKMLKEAIQNGYKTMPQSTKLEQFKSHYKDITLTNEGILMLNDRIIIPDALRSRLIELTHEAHAGKESCKKLIQSNYYFKDLNKMISDHCKFCVPCQAITDTSKYEPILPTTCPCETNSHWDIDFTSKTPHDDYMLVVIDEATRFPIVITTKRLTSDSAIQALKQIFSKYGMPKYIKSDNGPAFNSNDFRKFMKACNIIYQPITPVWPMANGSAERFMKNINRVIRCAGIEGSNWKHLMVQYINNYRATPHYMTKISPNEAMNFKDNVKFPTVNKPQRTNIMQQLCTNDAKSKLKMKKYGDINLKVKNPDFKINDLVLLKYDKYNKKISKKFDPIFDPIPYKIAKQNGSMITAERLDTLPVTRNSQFFRKFHTKSNALLEPITIIPQTDIQLFPVHNHFQAPILGTYIPRNQRNNDKSNKANDNDLTKQQSTNQEEIATETNDKSIETPTTSSNSLQIKKKINVSHNQIDIDRLLAHMHNQENVIASQKEFIEKNLSVYNLTRNNQSNHEDSHNSTKLHPNILSLYKKTANLNNTSINSSQFLSCNDTDVSEEENPIVKTDILNNTTNNKIRENSSILNESNKLHMQNEKLATTQSSIKITNNKLTNNDTSEQLPKSINKTTSSTKETKSNESSNKSTTNKRLSRKEKNLAKLLELNKIRDTPVRTRNKTKSIATPVNNKRSKSALNS